MLISDSRVIGSRLYELRCRRVMSRLEVAEKAGISDRTYADIERGSATMRVDTLMKICAALGITPNDILTVDTEAPLTEEEIINAFHACSPKEKQTALKLLDVYIASLDQEGKPDI